MSHADIYSWFDSIYYSYEVAFINSETEIVRLESSKGWFEEATLTLELAYWLLSRQLKVVYEN